MTTKGYQTDAEIEAAVRKTEANEWDTINHYVTLRANWKQLTKEMQSTRAGGVKWLKLEKQRQAVLTEYARVMFVGDERKAVLDLIEGVK